MSCIVVIVAWRGNENINLRRENGPSVVIDKRELEWLPSLLAAEDMFEKCCGLDEGGSEGVVVVVVEGSEEIDVDVDVYEDDGE